MTNLEINQMIGSLIMSERKITLKILHLINLAGEQKLHLERGFGSLHDWLIKEHKYSERAANRRIQAARLLRAVPAVSAKLEDGTVNLTTLAKAQSVIRAQEKLTGSKVSKEQKVEAVGRIENRSTLQAEQALLSIFPATASQVRQDRITVINQDVQRLSINLSNAAMEDLKRAQEILSHTVPSGQAAEVVAHVLNEFVKRMDPLKKKSGAAPAHGANRIQVIRRAEGSCTFKDPVTGRICGSRFQIERDHIYPRALGGSDSPENVRALCRKHNQFMAEKILGQEVANHWRLE